MKKYFLFATSLLLMLGSCSQDELANVSLMSENGKTTIVASIEGQPSTRMTVAQDGSLSWETNDNFIVFGGTNVTFTTTEQNAATGVFIGNGSPEAGSYAAYYPFNNTLSISENTLTVDLLASYNSAETFKAPMWGKYSEGSVSFKHLGAALEFSYADIPDGYSTLVVEASTPINGCFTATLTDDDPILATTEEATENNTKVSVTITENLDGTFYVPLPVGNYDLKVYAQNGNNKIELKSWSNLTIERKGLYYTSATYVTIAESTPAAVSSKIEHLQPNSIVDLTGTIDATADNAGNMILPNVDATYNFTETPTTSAVKPLTFEEADGGDGSNVNINMPADAAGLHVVIQTPNSTISLEGGTYESLEATTAENTLIIGEGVTIKKLVLNGGNVVLKGNVEIIISDEETIIKLDKDITLNNSMTFSKGNVTVDLNGKEIKCASSDVFVVTDGTLTINGEGTVWGSEDNSSSSCAVWAKGNGIVIINGGTYKVGHDGASKTAGSANWRNDCIYARDNAQITINGGEFAYTGEINTENFQSDGNRFLLNCRDQDYKAGTCSITVKGGTFHKFNPGATSSENPVANYVAAGYFSVARGNDTYVVEKGILDETALKAAIAAGKTEVTLGADITLSDYIEIRDKEIIINLNGKNIVHPSTSSAKYKDVFEIFGTGKLTINGEGNCIAEDGYTVYAAGDSKVTLNGGNYFSPVSAVDARKNASVTINGGIFKVDGSNNADGDYAQKYTLNLRDKTGSYATELAEIVVKGGKFYKYNPAASESEPVVTNFVADGYVSTKEGDYYVVTKQN